MFCKINTETVYCRAAYPLSWVFINLTQIRNKSSTKLNGNNVESLEVVNMVI